MNITIREKLLVEVLEFVAHKKGYRAGSKPGERAGDRGQREEEREEVCGGQRLFFREVPLLGGKGKSVLT